MDKYYTAIMAMIVFSMTVMLISVKFNIGLTKKRRRASAILFGIIIVGVVCEWSGNFLNGKDAIWIPLHILVKTIELSSAPFIGLLCGRSFDDSKWETPLFVVLSVNVVLEIASAFTGMIYYVDDANIYHHGAFYEIYLLSYVVGTLYFVCCGIAISRKFQGKYGMTILSVVVFVVICITVQLIDNRIT